MWEYEVRSTEVAVNEVVPILVAQCELVDQCRRNNGVQRKIAYDQMVFGEVAFGQVKGSVRLVIQAVVDLRSVAEVGAVLAVDHPIEPAVVAPFKKGTRNGGRGLIRETVGLC